VVRLVLRLPRAVRVPGISRREPRPRSALAAPARRLLARLQAARGWVSPSPRAGSRAAVVQRRAVLHGAARGRSLGSRNGNRHARVAALRSARRAARRPHLPLRLLAIVQDRSTVADGPDLVGVWTPYIAQEALGSDVDIGPV